MLEKLVARHCFKLAINMFKLNISMRWFFEHPKHLLKMMVKKKNYLKNFVYLNLSYLSASPPP